MTGTCSPGWLKAGTCMPQSMPKVCWTAILMSGIRELADWFWVCAGISICSDWAARLAAVVRLIREKALERGVGLVDALEPLFRRLVAAIGVRMKLLDQDLVANLDVVQGRRRLQLENGQRLLLGSRRTPTRAERFI